jgi:S1-C subfamily serine protease
MSVRVEGERFLVGSGPECQLMVGDPRVAPLHAYFEVTEDGRVLLHDLGSDEGTHVDGRRIDAPAQIGGGEQIRIGDTRLVPAVRSPEEEARELVAQRENGSGPEAPVRVRTGDGDQIEVVPEHGDGGEGPHLRVRSEGEAVEVVPVGEHRRLRERITLATALASLAGLAAVAAVAVFLATRGDDGSPTTAIVDAARPGTVLISAKVPGGEGGGSGFVLDAEQGLVVTNFHVVNGARSLIVGLDDDLREAGLHSAAPCEDLAVLKVSETAGMSSLPLGSQGDLKEGDRVVAVGYPGNAGNDLTLTSTEGVVSLARTTYRAGSGTGAPLSNVVQTDAALNPGNSGGPLLDARKRVIGVNTAVLRGRPVEGQGYAIGVDRLKEVLATLRTGRSIGYAGFGIEPAGGRGAVDAAGGVVAVPMAGTKGSPFVLTKVNGSDLGGTFAGYCDAVRSIESGQTAVLTGMAKPGAAPRQIKVEFR